MEQISEEANSHKKKEQKATKVVVTFQRVLR